jgi:hypothetical protein
MESLTQARLQEMFTLDKDRGELHWKIKHGRGRIGALAGWFDSGCNYYWRIQIHGKCYKRSHLIFLYVNGWRPKRVYHINRNKSDDNPNNLFHKR